MHFGKNIDLCQSAQADTGRNFSLYLKSSPREKINLPHESVCCLTNLFPNKPWFLRVCCTSLLKTLWEREKLLVTSNFSSRPSVSTHFDSWLPFSSNL